MPDATSLKMLKELSMTRPETGIGELVWSNFSAVAPPMLRPQKATFEVRPFYAKKLSTARKSSVSFHPRVTQSPSELPHPLKSKVKRSMPRGKSTAA